MQSVGRAERRPSIDFETLAGDFLGFELDVYLEDPEGLGELARKDAEMLHEFEAREEFRDYFDHAERMRNRGRARLMRLLRGRRQLNRTVEAADLLQSHLELRAGASAGRDGKSLVRDLHRLNEEGRGTVVDEDAMEAIRDGQAGDVGELLDLREDPRVTQLPDALRQQRDVALWYVAASYVNHLRVGSYAIDAHVEPREHRPSERDELEDRLEAIREGAIDRLRKLHAALSGAEWDRLDAEAARVSAYPLEVRPDMYELATRLREGRRFETEVDENPGQAAAFGSAEADLHRLERLLGLLLGTAHRLRFVARAAPVDERADELARQARSKGFASLVRDGVNVDVADLLDDADDYDDRFVEVEGHAANVRYDSDAPGTRFEVVDRLDGRSVPVFYPFRNLEKWHLHDGAYVRIHGDLDADSEWTGGPEVQLDTVNVGEHAGESWFDAATRRLAASDVLLLYPSRANATWSHERHSHDHGGA